MVFSICLPLLIRIIMIVITKAKAEMLRPGMIFDLFGKCAIIIYAEHNTSGMIVVRFDIIGVDDANYSVLIVQPDMLFNLVNLG